MISLKYMKRTKLISAVSATLLAATALLLAGCKPYDDTAIWEKINELENRLTLVENTLSGLNTEVESMSSIVKALQKRIYITGIVQVAGGYKISFSDGSSYNLATASAEQPADETPVIGVAEYNGVYYWTQTIKGNTTWLTDKNGDKIPVTGGSGTQGGGGITPRLSVSSDGYWIVSYDNGASYDFLLNENGEPIKAGCGCTSFFKSVTYANGILTFVLMDGTVIPIEVYRDTRLDNVVPEDIQAQMSDYMPFYTGVTPPSLENAYLMSPSETVFCEDSFYAPGEIVEDMLIKFSNFNSKDNVVDYEESNKRGTSYAASKGAFVSGSGNYFTAFFNTEGYSDGIATKTALVISGIVVNGGIKNLRYAFVMVEKGSDPTHKLMDEGVFRVFKDGDDFSEVTAWEHGDGYIPEGAVDLVLPSGNLWAQCNLGGSYIEEYANYYAWGETYPKSNYTWGTYKWCNGSETTLTKYNSLAESGKVDNISVLESSDDAASQYLNEKWHIPSYADFAELIDPENCTWTWTTKSGVAGYQVKSTRNNNFIFLPAAGVYAGSSLLSSGECCYYWASNVSSYYPEKALFLNADNTGDINLDYVVDRYYGLPIRPVYYK